MPHSIIFCYYPFYERIQCSDFANIIVKKLPKIGMNSKFDPWSSFFIGHAHGMPLKGTPLNTMLRKLLLTCNGTGKNFSARNKELFLAGECI
jgi:hypothetical protein